LKISREGAWLTNPWFDSIFLLAIPSIFIIMFLGFSPRALFPGNGAYIVYLLKKYLILLGTAHLIATVFIVFLDQNELRSRLFRYLWIPLLLIFVYIILRVRGFQDLNATALFYIIIVHIIFQNLFIMLAYNFTQAQYPKIDAVINAAAILMGPPYFLFWAVRYIKFDYGGLVANFYINKYILTGMGVLAFFSIAVFMARQVYIYLKWKRIAVFNILIVLISNSVFYFPLLVFKNSDVFMIGGFKCYHSLQFLGWLVLYCQLKFKEYRIKGPEFLAGFHLPHRAISLFVFFIFFGFIFIVIAKPTVLFFRKVIIYESIYYYFVIFHQWMDAFIWWNPRRISNLIALNK